MKNKKIITLGIAFALCFSVGAATGTKITAELKNQSINYKGNVSNQQIISYKGNMYISLKTIGNIIGAPFTYKDGIACLGQNESNKVSYLEKDIKPMAQSLYVTAEYAYNGKKRKSNVGDEYTNYLIFDTGAGKGNIDFPLKGKYKNFEAIFAVPDGGQDRLNGDFNIFLDGKNVYSKHYSPSDMPENIKIDVSGAQKISFTIEGESYLVAPIGLFDCKFIR